MYNRLRGNIPPQLQQQLQQSNGNINMNRQQVVYSQSPSTSPHQSPYAQHAPVRHRFKKLNFDNTNHFKSCLKTIYFLRSFSKQMTQADQQRQKWQSNISNNPKFINHHRRQLITQLLKKETLKQFEHFHIQSNQLKT